MNTKIDWYKETKMYYLHLTWDFMDINLGDFQHEQEEFDDFFAMMNGY